MNRRFFPYAVLFEAGLGVVGLVLCLLLGLPFQNGLHANAAAILYIFAGTAPPLASYFFLKRLPVAGLKEIERILRSVFRETMQSMPLWQIAVICLAAGFGEEMLFRGFLQLGFFALVGWGGFDAASPVAVALVFWLVSVVFAAGHAITKWYFVLSFSASLYFCVLYHATGNLFVVMGVHTLYDFIVFLRVRSECRREDAGF